jgi:hypothetical protein
VLIHNEIILTVKEVQAISSLSLAEGTNVRSENFSTKKSIFEKLLLNEEKQLFSQNFEKDFESLKI